MTEQSKNGSPVYIAIGHRIQRCDGSTGHIVRNIAFCDTPEYAAELVNAIARADLVEQMAEALESILPFIPKSSAAEGGPNARSANVAAADRVRTALSTYAAAVGSKEAQ